MTEGVIVLLCCLAFTGVMAWLNMKSTESKVARVVTYILLHVGILMSLVCLGFLFQHFIKTTNEEI